MTVLNLRVIITVTVSIIIKLFIECNYFSLRIFSATFFGTGSYLSKNME